MSFFSRICGLVVAAGLMWAGFLLLPSALAAETGDQRDTMGADPVYRAVLLADLSLVSTENNRKCLSPHDDMVLMVLRGSKIAASQHYCSSYASGWVRIFRDGLDNRFLVIAYGEGRGTNATTGKLKFYQISNGLIDLGDVTTYSGTGPFGLWRYEFEIGPVLEGGLRVAMQLKIEGAKPECCVPSERSKTVYFKPTDQAAR